MGIGKAALIGPVDTDVITPPWEFGITVKNLAQKFRTDFKNLQAKSSGKNQKRPDFTRGLFC